MGSHISLCEQRSLKLIAAIDNERENAGVHAQTSEQGGSRFNLHRGDRWHCWDREIKHF